MVAKYKDRIIVTLLKDDIKALKRLCKAHKCKMSELVGAMVKDALMTSLDDSDYITRVTDTYNNYCKDIANSRLEQSILTGKKM